MIGGLFLASAAIGMAQSSQPDPARMKRIWGSMMERITVQTDFWFEDGEFPRCIHLLRVQNVLDPKDYEIATNLGWMLENVQQYDEALATYVRFKIQNPNDKEAPYPEANFYFMKKAYAKVPPLLEPTLVKKPHPNTYRILAHSYERMSLLADAMRVWDSYLKLNPADGAAKANRKRVEDKMKNGAKPKKSL